MACWLTEKWYLHASKGILGVCCFLKQRCQPQKFKMREIFLGLGCRPLKCSH